MTAITQPEIDQQVFDLYDEYCHGRMDRREFLMRASVLVAGGLAMAQALLPRYALAQTISFTDSRIKANYVTYPSPGGNSGQMRGYLVQPSSSSHGKGPFPAVVVIHENRGLNPYIEDVARRAAVEGFLALAPDGLFPAGGYPGNDDDGRALQGNLDQGKLRADMLKVSGIWVSPAEVEAALVSHEAVLEAAVVGKEDEQKLVKPKAFVVLKPGKQVTTEELQNYVKSKLAPYKYPRWIEFVGELPKTATGKIQRFKLRQ